MYNLHFLTGLAAGASAVEELTKIFNEEVINKRSRKESFSQSEVDNMLSACKIFQKRREELL